MSKLLVAGISAAALLVLGGIGIVASCSSKTKSASIKTEAEKLPMEPPVFSSIYAPVVYTLELDSNLNEAQQKFLMLEHGKIDPSEIVTVMDRFDNGSGAITIRHMGATVTAQYAVLNKPVAEDIEYDILIKEVAPHFWEAFGEVSNVCKTPRFGKCIRLALETVVIQG